MPNMPREAMQIASPEKKPMIFTIHAGKLRLRFQLKFCCRPQGQFGLCDLAAMTAFVDPTSKPIEVQINNRCGIKRQKLREQQSADDGNAHGPAQLAASTGFQSKRQSAQQRCRCRHHDRSETQQARLVN